MLYTKEEIIELNKNGRNLLFNYVMTKKDKIVFYGTQSEIIDYVKRNCFEEDVLKYKPWRYRILDFIYMSINKKRKYKGFNFHIYDNGFERKIKIEKLFNNYEK